MVAEEDRGYGLGPKLASFHIDKHNLGSGGYTSTGIKNAEKIWNNRVQEFVRNGWYSELIKDGHISREQVRNIVDDFKKNVKNSALPDSSKNKVKNDKGTLLLYVDEDRISAIVYDSKFLEDQVEDYIYGTYHLGSEAAGSDTEYVFSFEYDADNYKNILVYTLLQIAKDDGYKISLSREGAAYIPLEGIKYTNIDEVNGKKILELTEDVMYINKLQRQEKSIRGKFDEYDEIYFQLVEMAESKYRNS